LLKVLSYFQEHGQRPGSLQQNPINRRLVFIENRRGWIGGCTWSHGPFACGRFGELRGLAWRLFALLFDIQSPNSFQWQFALQYFSEVVVVR